MAKYIETKKIRKPVELSSKLTLIQGLDIDRRKSRLGSTDLFYCTDTKELWIGNGSKLGGNSVQPFGTAGSISWGDISGNILDQLDLGDAATKDIGTTAGTVAAGNDSRFSNSGGGGGSTALTYPLTIGVGRSFGSYSAGDTISDGVTFEEIIRKMFMVIVAPTYVGPTLTLSHNLSNEAVTGATISPRFTLNWTPNNAGAVTNYKILQNGTIIHSASSIGTFTQPGFVLSADAVYTAEVIYAQGAIINDNTGYPNSTGRIPAGTITSSSVTITATPAPVLPSTVIYYGAFPTSVNATPNPITEAAIVSLPNTFASVVAATPLATPAPGIAGSQIRLSMQPGEYVVGFACPATNTTPFVVEHVLGNGSTNDIGLLDTTTVTIGETLYNVYTAAMLDSVTEATDMFTIKLL